MAYDISTRAFDYAQGIGLDKTAVMGLGAGIKNMMVAARANSLRPELAQARVSAGFDTMSRLGESTGSGQYGTARAAVDAYGFGKFAGFISESEQASANVAQAARSEYLGVLSDLDNREQNERQFQRQIDESRRNPLDTVLGLAPIFF